LLGRRILVIVVADLVDIILLIIVAMVKEPRSRTTNKRMIDYVVSYCCVVVLSIARVFLQYDISVRHL
jgi:hypothetical protein